MSEQEDLFDITIIGGGPTGLFAAFYAGMRKAKVKIIESMPQLGGQLSALYPEKYIYDVAGFPKVKAQDLVEQLTLQAQQFNPEIVLEQAVKELTKQEDETFIIQTDKETHYSKAIIITAGAGAFQPRRLQLEGAEAYENTNLHYFIKDLSAFAGKRVVVLGGGDSALDWSLMLEPLAEEVTIVHRRDKFRAHEHSVQLLEQSKVNILTPYEITGLNADNGVITQVELGEVKGEGKKTIDVDALIVNYGFVSSLGPIKDWGIEIEKNSILVNTKMETNIKGIYSAGDVCTYDGKVKLIATGFGEAPTAVNNAKAYIDPKARLHPGHSTSLF
ncbi:NAD(P)/FAD-dependent oxidoreductase [Alkalicoccobacillus porphyridii]|uniref:Ferredoxin--NADP reductase n=1 Tax=Alkalicoccobacillus porphyridii TaxID=2597270 RepID=A0A554A3C1_9BACI|nr:NAD(P)/FAD-dependent oxidoreductase [Alkalicoccobacillus porphyridii]TSB48197.1 NAD(P)/FAD-dependent oxidoreductase [Alkalicoccobacillus porphyridii]